MHDCLGEQEDVTEGMAHDHINFRQKTGDDVGKNISQRHSSPKARVWRK